LHYVQKADTIPAERLAVLQAVRTSLGSGHPADVRPSDGRQGEAGATGSS
jgi:hypothetical protein